MKVKLARHGGLVPERPGYNRTVDSVELSNSLLSELTHLVEAVTTPSVNESTNPGKARDTMQYEITIERPDGTTTLKQSETNMSPDFANLVSWLRRNGIRTS